jgi:hypothetical protein
MTEHSRLFPPSGARRWVNCTASAEAVTHYPDVPGESAQEGSAWHWVTERCLVDGVDASMFLGRTVVVRQDAVERRFVVTREMAVDVQLAVNFVRDVVKSPGESRVEARIDLSHIHPDCFGRCDLWHCGDDTLTVADGKYGRVDVPVLYPDGSLNLQMVLYALGVIEELSRRTHPRNMPARVRLVVIQPHSIQPGPRIKHHTVSVDQVLALEAVVRRAVERVVSSPTFVMGDWCRYCPALGGCPPTQDALAAIAPVLLGNGDMSGADAGRILQRASLLEAIVERARDVARENLMRGAPVPGFKLVTGVKHRKWTDEDAAADAAADVRGAFKVVTPAQMEKLPGGRVVVDRFAAVPPGDPVVAPESDKRAPYVARSAEQIFGT